MNNNRISQLGEVQDSYDHQTIKRPKGSIGNIYQSFAGQEIYESLEEKATNLLYFVTKNHGFYDGNKRIKRNDD